MQSRRERIKEAALTIDGQGAQLYPGTLDRLELSQLRRLTDPLPPEPGIRILGGEIASIVAGGALQNLAIDILGPQARPVRTILFNKTTGSNWPVGWHQDRTIAVRERRAVEGFGPWSRKDGVIHVEPPFAVLRGMITLRAHLDDCDGDNAPLLIAPGSHRLGRVPTAAIPAAVARLGSVPCLARAGDVWAYATSIIHASHRARVPRRRRVLHVDYAAAPLPGGLEWLGIAGEPAQTEAA
jgi:hypothetical protein